MSDHSTFKPVGEAAEKVVVNLGLYRDLKGTVALLNKRDELKRMEVDRGRAMIMKGLDLIRQNGSPDSAIQYLQEQLNAISGSKEP